MRIANICEDNLRENNWEGETARTFNLKIIKMKYVPKYKQEHVLQLSTMHAFTVAGYI